MQSTSSYHFASPTIKQHPPGAGAAFNAQTATASTRSMSSLRNMPLGLSAAAIAAGNTSGPLSPTASTSLSGGTQPLAGVKKGQQQGSMNVVSSSDDIPPLVGHWLTQLHPRFAKYTEVLSRHGIETTFVLGLIDNEEELVRCGLWPDDAAIIVANLPSPRRLVAQWTPMISTLPTNTSVAVWLGNLPVPATRQHASPLLESLGFGHLGALRHIQLEDLKDPATNDFLIPFGHALAITHCAMSMDLGKQDPPPPSIELFSWLAHLNPPLEHYHKTLQLEGLNTVQHLMCASKEKIMDMELIKIGHRRVLWHYCVVLRTHWFDPL